MCTACLFISVSCVVSFWFIYKVLVSKKYSYITLSSQFNFPCDKLVPASFTSICIKIEHQFVLVKLFIQFNILQDKCTLFHSVCNCVKVTLIFYLQVCVFVSISFLANIFYWLQSVFLRKST